MKTVVFGSERIGAIWGLRNNVSPHDTVLATEGAEGMKDIGSEITVVRVSEHAWKPTTFPCEKRTAETEQELNRIRRNGGKITEVEMK